MYIFNNIYKFCHVMESNETKENGRPGRISTLKSKERKGNGFSWPGRDRMVAIGCERREWGQGDRGRG
jgi:hypothetical protein